MPKTIMERTAEEVLGDINGDMATEDALWKALEYNQKITETSPVGIVVVTKDGQIEFANQRAESTLGLKKSHITKLKYNAPEWKITDFEGNEFPESELPFIRVMNERKTIFDIQHAIKWPNNKTVYLSINASPKYDGKGEFDGMVASIEDITERVIAERNLKQINSFREMIINNAAEGLCVCHNCSDFPFVEFTVWNDKMHTITGYTIDEINEKGWYQSLYTDLTIREKAIARMQAMREGEDIIAEEWEITTKNNKNKTIAISTSIISSVMGTTHVMALISDVTEKKKQSETIERQNRELKNLNKLKDKFLSILSHDLKAPMGSQIELLKVVLENYEEYTAEQLQVLIQKLLSNINNSYDLIENILNWATLQIGKGITKSENCRLYAIAMDTVNLFQEALGAKAIDIEIKIKKDLSALVDINIIKTVFRNLISNAIKFSNSGGKILIGSKLKKDIIIAYVKDNGIGMNAKTKSTLFQKGETMISYGTKQEKGSGLGLLICKDLLASIHADIWVESDEGQGACFYFSLPRANN